MSGHAVAVLIMARAPRPGAVKTRLQPLLGAAGCARLQTALIAHTVALARRIAPSATYLALDPPDRSALPPHADGVRLLAQHGDDLGARMSRAVDEARAEHEAPVLVIGTDAPTLGAVHLRAAVSALEAGVDAVFGPAQDGGYYLVGLREPAPELFTIDPALWGGPHVLAASLHAAERGGLRTALLEPVRDLDTPADARALLDGGDLPDDIAALLRVEEGAS